jgi:SAM-dependent methyltransferase
VAKEVGYFAADAEYQAELNRLRLREALRDPFTTWHLTNLGVGTGWRCLEIGAGAGSIARCLSERVGSSGHVLATDIDTRFLSDLTLPYVEVRAHDITRDELDADAFDLVHCRAVLCHLRDPKAVLGRLKDALVQGGWLLAEEPDFGTIKAIGEEHSLAEGFNSASPKRTRYLAEIGIMDGYFGRSLPARMEAVGFSEVGNYCGTVISRGGDSASQVWLSLCDRLDGYLHTQGVLSEKEVADSREALQDPTFRYRLHCVLDMGVGESNPPGSACTDWSASPGNGVGRLGSAVGRYRMTAQPNTGRPRTIARTRQSARPARPVAWGQRAWRISAPSRRSVAGGPRSRVALMGQLRY